jgi:hypothetical protein
MSLPPNVSPLVDMSLLLEDLSRGEGDLEQPLLSGDFDRQHGTLRKGIGDLCRRR